LSGDTNLGALVEAYDLDDLKEDNIEKEQIQQEITTLTDFVPEFMTHRYAIGVMNETKTPLTYLQVYAKNSDDGHLGAFEEKFTKANYSPSGERNFPAHSVHEKSIFRKSGKNSN